MPAPRAARRAALREALRAALRVAVVLWLALALLILAALYGEYPGWSSAGLSVAAREPLPMALLGWLHLVALDRAASPTVRGDRGWAAAALAGDLLVVALAAPRVGGGAPVGVLAPPLLAAAMAACLLGLAWRDGPWPGRSRGHVRPAR